MSERAQQISEQVVSLDLPDGRGEFLGTPEGVQYTRYDEVGQVSTHTFDPVEFATIIAMVERGLLGHLVDPNAAAQVRAALRNKAAAPPGSMPPLPPYPKDDVWGYTV